MLDQTQSRARSALNLALSMERRFLLGLLSLSAALVVCTAIADGLKCLTGQNAFGIRTLDMALAMGDLLCFPAQVGFIHRAATQSLVVALTPLRIAIARVVGSIPVPTPVPRRDEERWNAAYPGLSKSLGYCGRVPLEEDGVWMDH